MHRLYSDAWSSEAKGDVWTKDRGLCVWTLDVGRCLSFKYNMRQTGLAAFHSYSYTRMRCKCMWVQKSVQCRPCER